MPNQRSKNGQRPGQRPGEGTTLVADRPAPTMERPVMEGTLGAGSGTAAPTLVPEDVSAESMSAISDVAPTLTPPARAAAVGEAVGAVTATWRTGVYVTALWSINQVRNAYMFVQGIGWRKLFNGRDGAYTALVTLASQARQTGRPVSFREEADGMVYEIYLW